MLSHQRACQPHNRVHVAGYDEMILLNIVAVIPHSVQSFFDELRVPERGPIVMIGE